MKILYNAKFVCTKWFAFRENTNTIAVSTYKNLIVETEQLIHMREQHFHTQIIN